MMAGCVDLFLNNGICASFSDQKTLFYLKKFGCNSELSIWISPVRVEIMRFQKEKPFEHGF